MPGPRRSIVNGLFLDAKRNTGGSCASARKPETVFTKRSMRQWALLTGAVGVLQERHLEDNAHQREGGVPGDDEHWPRWGQNTVKRCR